MKSRFMTKWVCYIHWDEEHCSPPIGPFNGITECREWLTSARKIWRETRPDVKVPRTEIKILAEPERAFGWMEFH